MKEIAVRPWWIEKTELHNSVVRLRQNAFIYRGAPSLYYPTGLDSALFAYALACLEVVLKRSYSAAHDHAAIVDAWRAPGLQAYQKASLANWPETQAWIDKGLAGTAPEWSNALKKCIQGLKDNEDALNLNALISGFMLTHFNRRQDIENEVYKVKPSGESKNLIFAINLRSISDYVGYDAPRAHDYRQPGLNRAMQAKPYPKTRGERQLRKRFTDSAKAHGYRLKADDTLLNMAEMWYEARVNHDKAYEAADLFHIDPFDLSKRIRLCDDATGYPAHR